LGLEEEISVLPEDIETYGVDDLQYFPADLYLSLRDLAYRLVNYSDNAAWVTLDRRLGEEKIRSELEGMGIENSRYYGYLSGYYTTPDDVLLLLERISDPQFTSQELSAEMLDAMTETTLEDRIPEKLPRDVRVAHKTGSYDDHFGDAGVVFYKDGQGVERRYYLAVLAKDTNEDGARDAIQSISLVVYEALTGTKVDRGWSRGDQDLRESGVDDQAGWVDNTEEPAHLEGGLDNSWADWTSPAKNAGKNEETVEPARPSGEKASAGRRYNAVPNPSYETAPYLGPDAWETVDPETLYSAFPEENSYWEETAELW